MVQGFDRFRCLTCPEEPELGTRTEIIRHITDQHGDIKGTSAKKEFKLHLDYRSGWESYYKWDFGIGKLYERKGER
jgi:hypothetical protein